MTRDRYKYMEEYVEGKYPHFVTCTTINWMPVFSIPPLAEIVIESLTHMHETGRMVIHAWVIMENHVHLVVSADDLPKQIANFKSFTARRIIDWMKDRKNMPYLEEFDFWKAEGKSDRHFQLWQEGVHPVVMARWSMYKSRVRYVHNNPVKRGYVDKPEHWRYSSARDYAGDEGLVPVTMLVRGSQ